MPAARGRWTANPDRISDETRTATRGAAPDPAGRAGAIESTRAISSILAQQRSDFPSPPPAWCSPAGCAAFAASRSHNARKGNNDSARTAKTASATRALLRRPPGAVLLILFSTDIGKLHACHDARTSVSGRIDPDQEIPTQTRRRAQRRARRLAQIGFCRSACYSPTVTTFSGPFMPRIAFTSAREWSIMECSVLPWFFACGFF